MVAKNIIGPTTITIFYIALKHGIDLRRVFGHVVVFPRTGDTIARMFFASYCSTVLFPVVVILAAMLGPVLQNCATSLCAYLTCSNSSSDSSKQLSSK